MRNYLFIGLLFFSAISVSQSNWKQFKKLSSPKKIWVLFHPFKANKALMVSKEAYRIADSIKKSPLLDGDASGGQVDAFRHAFWMASLTAEIGWRKARKLGVAHEKGNYKDGQSAFTYRALQSSCCVQRFGFCIWANSTRPKNGRTYLG